MVHPLLPATQMRAASRKSKPRPRISVRNGEESRDGVGAQAIDLNIEQVHDVAAADIRRPQVDHSDFSESGKIKVLTVR